MVIKVRLPTNLSKVNGVSSAIVVTTVTVGKMANAMEVTGNRQNRKGNGNKVKRHNSRNNENKCNSKNNTNKQINSYNGK